MSKDIVKIIENRIKDNKSAKEIKEELLSEGYSETDINSALNTISLSVDGSKVFRENYLLMKRKFFLDKLGFGIASNQFINILFSLIGAGAFVLVFFNALKSGLSNLFSSVFQEYTQRVSVNKTVVNIAGVIFGFTFLFIAGAIYIKSMTLFAISMLLGAIGVVVYGDLFKKYQDDSVGIKKKVLISPGLAFAGLLLTFIAMIISGLLMDMIPLEGKIFTIGFLGGADLTLHGFLIAFEVTAIIFIISSLLLSKMKFKKGLEKVPFKEFIQDFIELTIRRGKQFFSNKNIFILSITTLFFAVFQTIIYSLAGVFIFDNFAGQWISPFVDIAIIFGLPVLLSIFGPLLSSKLNKYLGLTPLLVFGSILVAIFPLTLAYNQFLPAILLANLFAVFGAALIGTTRSLLASRLLNEVQRSLYYKYSGLILIVPYIILTTVFMLFTHQLEVQEIFKYAGFGLIIFLVPLFFILVFWSRKKNISDA